MHALNRHGTPYLTSVLKDDSVSCVGYFSRKRPFSY